MSLEARRVLKTHWGYDSFRACQEEIIDSVLSGNDTLGLMPTGGGKSITFQVPAMILPGMTLVVTPLISLMKDQVDNLAARHVKAMALHSGLTMRENNVALNHIEAGVVKILYVSPEKLRSERFQSLLRRLDVSLIVVDEAHCISQWGYDFRPNYLMIADVRRFFPGVPVLALTASATPQVVDDIMSKLEFRDRRHVYRLSFSRQNISYLVRRTENKEAKMVEILSKVPGTAIVYVRSRRRTIELAAVLSASGISAEGYHAGLTPEVKAERQQRWKSGETRVIVATNAFGMGIDKPDVRIVIHHDVPPSLEEYYQEAGRAGRDGLESFAVMLLSSTDRGVLTRRLSDSFPGRDYVRDVYSRACVFLNIAMGEGYETLHEFNFKLFCERFKLQPARVYSSLGILSRSGYFDYQEDYNSRSRVMMTVDKQELYNLRLDPVVDQVLKTLLRTYTGLFADYEYISESVIAIRGSVTEQQVYDSLLQLARMRVIHFVPRNSNPMLLLTASRVEGKHVVIPLTVYEHRREELERRLNAIKRFAFEEDGCRVNTLLEYFGETPTGTCGKCDWCRARRHDVADARQSTASAVRLAIEMSSPVSVAELAAITRRSVADVINVVRELADDGIVSIEGDKVLLN